MANDNKEIGEIVKKCKILLLDIEGTTTSISFVKDKLFPYAEENVKQYLESQWDSEDVKGAVSALRKLALEDQEKSLAGVVAIPGEDASKDDQIEGLVKNVKWQMSSDRKVGPLKHLQGLIWKQGYDNGDIKGHVYDDVSPALEQWRSVEGQKVYIYSSGSVDAQKLLFRQSLAGDLLRFIDGHFDTAVGAKQEATSYASIAEKIGCKPDEILFLTDIVKEAEAARASGLHTALVSREGNAPLPTEATDAYAVIHSLEQLTATNKRKPDEGTQDEVPAKVAKTDIENDVKTTTSETESKEPEVEAAPKSADPEPKKPEEEKQDAMEVEEPGVANDSVKVDKVKDVPMEGPIVEEITDAKELEDVPVSEVEPIITEEKEKTEETETEKMEAELVEAEETSKPNGAPEVKNGDVSAPVAEETPPTTTIITEIEEVSEKQDLDDVGDIDNDLEPVVEEPTTAEDMEDLQNVGEVLEKECDEILSKVQDVTNLDNIPLKPLLNPIAEEMETENGDTNDIVDRILDTELELEMKQCEDIDLNTVQEITDPKTDAEQEKMEKVEKDNDAPKTPEEKASEIKENNVTDGNVTSSSTKTETKVEENKMDESKTEETIKEQNKTDESKINDIKTEESEVEQTRTETPTVPSEKVKESPEEESMVVETVEKEVKETATESKEEKSVSATEEKVEKKENDKVPEVKDVEVKEPQINGKATNGDAEARNVNGDASKNEELSSRLSVEENGSKTVNGSNGDAVDEAGQGDSKSELEMADIKVKTVADVSGAGDEPRTDPIEQPTEA